MPLIQKHTAATLSSLSAQSASYNTDAVDLTLYHAGSFQIVITTGGAVTWTVAVQGSNDGTTFVDTATPTNVTTSVNLILSLADLTSRFYRVAFVRTGGTLSTAEVKYVAKAKR